LPKKTGFKGKIRKAAITDAVFIHAELKKYAQAADLVVKPLGDIYSQIRDYFIMEVKGKPAGVIALHVYWDNLAEIRSFVIEEKYRGAGGGVKLLRTAIAEAGDMGLKQVFALTKIPDFFLKHGFVNVEKNLLPQKIWKDCLNCPKFPDCDETAVIYTIKEDKPKR
jgi:amino-acid N-acetyltransferase